MAIVVSNRSSFRLEKKPWMLRDYLRDDMSSCSSNGFKSFPRKQCCVAVKNMIENEVIRTTTRSKSPKKLLSINRSVSSALHRASLAVIKAAKLLPFNSAATTTQSNGGIGRRFLPRSFSKKLFSRSFFGKKPRGVGLKSKTDTFVEQECDKIKRWISSGVVTTEKYEPIDLSNDTSVTNISTSSVSNSNSNCNNSSDGKSSSDDNWSDITFTSDYLNILDNNHIVKRREGKKNGGREEEEVVSKSIGVIVGEKDSAQNEAAIIMDTWCDEEAEKKQLSPISVMDFPCNDDGSASPFSLRVSRLKGTKERLMEKLGRLESLASGIGLDPINLESLMSSTDMEDQSPKHSIQSCSTPSFILSSECDSEHEEQSREDEEEQRVQNLLKNIKLEKINYKIESENLLLDFLRDNVAQKTDDALVKSAEKWLNGHYDTLILGWEVKDKREAYIQAVEERGGWPRDCNIEKEEVEIELGNQMLEHLIQEIILQLF